MKSMSGLILFKVWQSLLPIGQDTTLPHWMLHVVHTSYLITYTLNFDPREKLAYVANSSNSLQLFT